MQRATETTLCAIFTLIWTSMANAQGVEEEDLALAYGDKSFVSIATGSRLPVARAPAVATVITQEDIKAIGATDLDHVLETVPGIHVSRSTLGTNPIYVFRGIHSNTNPQVLILINGIPMTSIFSGDRGNVWGGFPLENVARVEVIRGPGSALYGADAFSGVINVITKTSADINGLEAGLRAGSFKASDGWILSGGKLGVIDAAAYFRVGSTDGARKTITADQQTALDAVFGTQASHAPGPLNNDRDTIDGQVDLAYEKWRLRTGYKQLKDAGSGSGVASALDPTGKNSSKRFTSDLTYHNMDLTNDWGVNLQASYLRYSERSDLILFPPGAFGGAFPDGMIGNPYKWERHTRLNGSAFYTGFKNHRIHLGAGYQKQEIYKIQESKNFTFIGLFPVPLGSVVDVSNTAPFLHPHSRILRYVFAQDEWSFAKDWTITAGVRRDNYSDFGGVTNPRFAIVWNAAYNLTAKVLYGRAFRAPSFTELYNINNPVQIGNPDLKPETIQTYEAALSWRPATDLRLGMTVFRYEMDDILRFVSNANPATGSTAQNTGEQTGRGLELEVAWDATKALRLMGNYAYQRSIDKATDQDAGNAPHHHLYLRTDWQFAAKLFAGAQVNWVADRKRAVGDGRQDVPDYTTIDLTLRAEGGRDQWSFTASARNIFNTDVREPSPAPGLIPNDFPQPGRSFFIEARYRI